MRLGSPPGADEPPAVIKVLADWWLPGEPTQQGTETF
jgi:hypothetical protein